MNMLAIGVGGLLVAGGAYLSFVQKKKTEGKITELKFMRPLSLAEFSDTWKSLADEGLGDSFRDMVATHGKAETDGELKAPYSETPCAYFEATVIREFEKEERKRDEDGNMRVTTRRSSETISSRKSPSPLYIADGDVRVAVDMDGASLYLRDGEDRFEPFDSKKTYSFFGVQFTAPASGGTLGFRYKESIIPLGHPLYVVGEGRKSGGALRIGKPSEAGKPFIVSTRSAEEVIENLKGSAKGTFYLGIALMVIGAAVAAFMH